MSAVAVISDTRRNAVERTVVFEGVRPIMFDRYAGDNNTKLTWDQKCYPRPNTNQLVLPIFELALVLHGYEHDVSSEGVERPEEVQEVMPSVGELSVD